MPSIQKRPLTAGAPQSQPGSAVTYKPQILKAVAPSQQGAELRR
jgi:hypothetical protein